MGRYLIWPIPLCAAGPESSSPTHRDRPDAPRLAKAREAREREGGPQHFWKAEKAQIAQFTSLECQTNYYHHEIHSDSRTTGRGRIHSPMPRIARSYKPGRDKSGSSGKHHRGNRACPGSEKAILKRARDKPADLVALLPDPHDDGNSCQVYGQDEHDPNYPLPIPL